MKLFNANLSAQKVEPETVLSQEQLEQLSSILFQRLENQLLERVVDVLLEDPSFLDRLHKKLEPKTRKATAPTP